MKIVQENIAGGLSGQLVAERIHQQGAAGGVCGTGVIAQKIKPGAIKGVLHVILNTPIPTKGQDLNFSRKCGNIRP